MAKPVNHCRRFEPYSLAARSVVITLLVLAYSPVIHAFEIEPNNTEPGNEVSVGAGGQGTLHLFNDPQDWLYFVAPQDGEVSIRVIAVSVGLDPDLYVYDEFGGYLDESTGESIVESVDLTVTEGEEIHLLLQAAGGVGGWYLSLLMDADPPTIQSDSCGGYCSCGGSCVGTSVTLYGDGFGSNIDEVKVDLAGVVAELVSVSPGQLEFLVPNGAVNGDILVEVAGAISAAYPLDIGDSSSPPVPVYSLQPPLITDTTPDGNLVIVDTLDISFCPSVETDDIFAVLDQVVNDLGLIGYQVVGQDPSDNTLQVRFDGPQDYGDLDTLILELENYAEVDSLIPDVLARPAGMRWDVDPLAVSQHAFAPSYYGSYLQAGVVPAWDLYRTAEVYVDPGSTARVAVIDSGFKDGGDLDNFPADRFTSYRLYGAVLGWHEGQTGLDDKARHGVAVSSVIGAGNKGGTDPGGMNGVLAGFQSDHVDEDQDGEYADAESIPYEVIVFQAAVGSTPRISLGLVRRALRELVKLENAHPDDTKLVINLSMAVETAGASNAEARDYADIYKIMEDNQHRFLFVVAAGNDGGEYTNYWPGKAAETLDNVVAVAATRTVGVGVDRRWDEGADNRSAWGDQPSVIAAPGHRIPTIDITTGTYGRVSGTSLAAPFVSASAALIWYLVPQLSPSEVRTVLIDSGDNVSPGWAPHDVVRLELRNALRTISRHHGSPVFPRGDVFAYTANEGSDSVSMVRLEPADKSVYIDPFTSNYVVDVESLGVDCSGPVDLASSPDGHRLYVLCHTSDTLSILDAQTLDVLKTEDLPVYDAGQGKRLTINAEEVVAIPMEDGADNIYLALYEGRTDTWWDSNTATVDIDPFDLTFSYEQSVDVTATVDADAGDFQDTFWVQGYGPSALMPGGLCKVIAYPSTRAAAPSYDIDLTAVGIPAAYEPSGITSATDGTELYSTYSHVSTSVDMATTDGIYPNASSGDTCGNIGGISIGEPKDIAVVPGATIQDVYWANDLYGVITRYNLADQDCRSAYHMGFPTSASRVAVTRDGGTVLGTFTDVNSLAVFEHDTGFSDEHELTYYEDVGVGASDPLGVDSLPPVSILSPRPGSKPKGFVRFEIVVRADLVDSVTVEMQDASGNTISDTTRVYTHWNKDDGVINRYLVRDTKWASATKPIFLVVTTEYDTGWSFVTKAKYY